MARTTAHAHASVPSPSPSIFRAPPRLAPPPEIAAIQADVRAAGAWVEPLRTEIGRVLVGQHALVDRLIVALLAGGHVLLEGMPGLAKTLALKTLSQAISTSFQRIQFTPDMLPADIVGTLIYNPRDGEFVTKHGPLFANLILADEINRAPAKVQSALLEAMQEHQVTLGETTHRLPEPFMVMATQNPVEQEGTYPLPEAQIDRFLLKVIVTYPSPDEELAILGAMATSAPRLEVSPVLTTAELFAARRAVDAIYIDERVRRYIVSLVVATRDPAAFGLDISPLVRFGASPRATIALALCAKAWAFLQGRGYVTPQDVKAIAPDVLRHRIAVTYEAEAERIDSEQLVARVLDQVAIPLSSLPTAVLPASALAPAEPVDPSRVRAIMERVRTIELQTRGLVTTMISGSYQAAFRGRGIDFDRVREYVPGDEVRTIDWNVTARAGHPFVKQFREERELELVLLVDVSASGEFGSGEVQKRELAAELACVLAMSAIRNNDRVGLILFSDQIERFVPPGKGRGHALRVVREILACKPAHRGTDIAAALRFAGTILRRRALLFVISDLELGVPRAAKVSALDRAIRPVAAAHDVIAMHIRDPHERELPDVGVVALEDAETGEVVEIDTGRRKIRERFAAAARARAAETVRMLRRVNVEVLELDATASYVPVLLAFFAGRERRQR